MGAVTSATAKAMKTPVGVYNNVICCERLLTNLYPAFSKSGTWVDKEIVAGVDQETRLCEPIRQIESAG